MGVEQDILEQHGEDCDNWDPVDNFDIKMMTNEEDWKQELERIGWPLEPKLPFSVNEWGSCQYSTANSIYRIFFMMRQNLSREDTMKTLGVVFSHEGIRKFEDAKEEFKAYAVNRYKDVGHYIIDSRRVQNYDDMFFVFRNWASDLWKASPTILMYAFKNVILKAPVSPGKGSPCNCCAQADNFTVGLSCAILKEYGLVKNESSFAGFDT